MIQGAKGEKRLLVGAGFAVEASAVDQGQLLGQRRVGKADVFNASMTAGGAPAPRLDGEERLPDWKPQGG